MNDVLGPSDYKVLRNHSIVTERSTTNFTKPMQTDLNMFSTRKIKSVVETIEI
jgi:hypothetical protein